MDLQDRVSSSSGTQLPRHQTDRDEAEEETEGEREFRDELESQVSWLMDGELL